jgi:hypothetical protein
MPIFRIPVPPLPRLLRFGVVYGNVMAIQHALIPFILLIKHASLQRGFHVW